MLNYPNQFVANGVSVCRWAARLGPLPGRSVRYSMCYIRGSVGTIRAFVYKRTLFLSLLITLISLHKANLWCKWMVAGEVLSVGSVPLRPRNEVLWDWCSIVRAVAAATDPPLPPRPRLPPTPRYGSLTCYRHQFVSSP